MSLPVIIDNTSPLGTESPAFGDDHLRNIKDFIVSVLGIPNNTAVTGAMFSVTSAGVVTVSQAGFTLTTLVLAAGALTTDTKVIDATATWNNAGVTFTGFKLNVTDTTSASASLLLDLQIASSSKFSVKKDGSVVAAGPLTGTIGNFSATSNQLVLQSGGVTGTITWTPTGSNKIITIPDVTGTLLTSASMTSITSLGTVTVGVWNATAIAAGFGGTGITSYAIGDLLYASGSATLSKLADVAVGSYLRSGGVTTAPLWSTVTLPNTAAQGDLWYGSATNVISALAGVATGQVLVSGTTPSWSPSPIVASVTATNVGATAPDFQAQGANGQSLNIKQVTELHALAAAATSDTTITFPASCLALGVALRITSAISGAASIDVGVPFATTRYGTGINPGSGVTHYSTGTTNPSTYSLASVIRFTAIGGGGAFSAGVIRISLYYMDLTPPTS